MCKEGYTVDACYDGEEALDYLLCADYDGIILDIMMPKKDVIYDNSKEIQYYDGYINVEDVD